MDYEVRETPPGDPRNYRDKAAGGRSPSIELYPFSKNQHWGAQSTPVIELLVPLCCDKCEEKIEETLLNVAGVRSITCDRNENRVTVMGFVNPEKVLRAARKVKRVAKISQEPRPLPIFSSVDVEVLLNQVQEQRKPSSNKPRSMDAEDIRTPAAYLNTASLYKSLYREIEHRPKDDLYIREMPVYLRSSLFSKPQDLQPKDDLKRMESAALKSKQEANSLVKDGMKEEKGPGVIFQEHEGSSKAATTELDKTLDKRVMECLQSFFKLASSPSQNDIDVGKAHTTTRVDPNRSKYFDLLKGKNHAWLHETYFEVPKLLEMLNNYPDLLMEVCPESQHTVLHVAVMANSEMLMTKVWEMVNDYANKAMNEVYANEAMNEVSSDNSIQGHRSKIWKFIFAVEKASNYTASELGAVLGIKNILKMDDDSELFFPMVHSTYLQSCPSCACEKSKETIQRLPPLESNGKTKDLAESKDCLRRQDIANILSKDLCQQDGMKIFLQKGSQLLAKEYSLHAFIAAPLYSNGFLSWEGKHNVENCLKAIIEKLHDKSLLPTLLHLRDPYAGKTLLHYLAEYHFGSCIFPTVMKMLKEDGYVPDLDVNIKDYAGRTPLHYGAARGSIKAVQHFVEDDKTKLGEKFSMENIWVDKYNTKSKQHVCLTALALAMNHDHVSVAETLLKAETLLEENRLDVNVECTQYIKLHSGEHIPESWAPLHQSSGEYVSKSWTPLQLAAWKGQLKILQMLLKNGEVKDYGFKNQGKRDDKEGEGAPALHVAALGGKLHAVKALLESEKVDPFALDRDGNTALHYATLAYDCEDINDGPWNFVSISHLRDYSKSRRKKERNIAEIIGCLELLVQAGLNMNKKNNQGLTPQFGPQTPPAIQQWWYDKLATEARDQKGNIILATNAVSVIGALVAATSFVGPLQPPLGLSSNTDEMWLFGYSEVNHGAVEIFFFFGSLSFYLAIASILLALISNLPIPGEGLLNEVRRNQVNLQGAVILLFASIIFIMCAFGAASIAVIPEGRWKYKAIIISTTIIGGFTCLLVFSFFFRRLWKISSPSIRNRIRDILYSN